MTSNTWVVGMVTSYDYINQSGTIYTVEVEQVWFDQTTCREVDGTKEEPVLTDRPDPCLPTVSDPRTPRDAWIVGRTEWVVLRLMQVPGTNQYKATAWGYLPPPAWLQKLAQSDLSGRFAGGTATVSYLQEHPFDSPYQQPIECHTGEIEWWGPRIELEDSWTLSMRLGMARKAPRIGWDEELLNIPLRGARPLPYHCFSQNCRILTPVLGPGDARWALIVLEPSG